MISTTTKPRVAVSRPVSYVINYCLPILPIRVSSHPSFATPPIYTNRLNRLDSLEASMDLNTCFLWRLEYSQRLGFYSDLYLASISRYSAALHAASALGHKGVVQMLLDKGVNVNLQGGRNRTALHLAAEKRPEAVLRLLL